MQNKYKTDNDYAIEHRKAHIKRVFKLSWEEYLKLYTEQDGKCAICSKDIQIFTVRSISKSASIDHDHITGKIRALLCHRCNCGLGNFNDNIDLMEKAQQYLEAFSHR